MVMVGVTWGFPPDLTDQLSWHRRMLDLLIENPPRRAHVTHRCIAQGASVAPVRRIGLKALAMDGMAAPQHLPHARAAAVPSKSIRTVWLGSSRWVGVLNVIMYRCAAACFLCMAPQPNTRTWCHNLTPQPGTTA